MRYSFLNYPDLYDKLNSTPDIMPYMYYYCSFGQFTCWIKRTRNLKYVVCAYGYNHKLFYPKNKCVAFDELSDLTTLDSAIEFWKSVVRKHLFFEFQQELISVEMLA